MVGAEFNLYHTKDETLLWSEETDTVYSEDFEKLGKEYARALVKQLKKDKVIQKRGIRRIAADRASELDRCLLFRCSNKLDRGPDTHKKTSRPISTAITSNGIVPSFAEVGGVSWGSCCLVRFGERSPPLPVTVGFSTHAAILSKQTGHHSSTGAPKPRCLMSILRSQSSSPPPPPANSDSGSFFWVPATLPYRGC